MRRAHPATSGRAPRPQRMGYMGYVLCAAPAPVPPAKKRRTFPADIADSRWLMPASELLCCYSPLVLRHPLDARRRVSLVSHRSSASRLGLPVSSSSLSLKKKKKKNNGHIYSIGFLFLFYFPWWTELLFVFSSSVFLPMFSLQSYCY